MIIEHSKNNMVKVSSLKDGDVFLHECNLYIKTSEYLENTITCVRLDNGDVDWFKRDALVVKKEAKVVVIDDGLESPKEGDTE